MSYFKKRLAQESVSGSEGDHAPFPTNALVELSNGCNHSCVFCNNAVMKRKPGLLDLETFTAFVREGVAAGLVEIGLYATGEPFIVNNLEKYVSIAKKSGIKRVYLTTNGALAKIGKVIQCVEAGLDSIKFSVNAGTRETYKLIHGSDDFLAVVDNIKQIDDFRKSSPLNLQLLGSCVLTKASANEKEAHNNIFGKYLDDIIYVNAQTQGGRNAEFVDLVSPLPKRPISIDYEPCWMLWKRLHLTCDGFLTCCCVDYEYDLVFYDYKQNLGSLVSAWNSDLIKSIRRKHLQKDLSDLICHNCLTGDNCTYSPLDASLQATAKFISPEQDGLRRDKLKNRIKDLPSPGL